MSEANLQKAVATYLNNQERLFKKFVWFHPMTWGHNKAYGAIMQGRGCRAGVPDCCIMTSEGKTIFIELKTKKGQISSPQKIFHQKLTFLDHPVHVVKAEYPMDAVNQVEKILKAHLPTNEQSGKEIVPCRQ